MERQEIAEIAKKVAARKVPDLGEEELKKMMESVPFRIMQSKDAFARYIADKKVSYHDFIVAYGYVLRNGKFFDSVKVTNDISFGDTLKILDDARTNFIIIHRINFILYDMIVGLFNILERDGRLKMNVKKAAKDIEKQWEAYRRRRKAEVEREAWFTMQDHLNIAREALDGKINGVYEAIRNNMIAKGMRDVEVKAWCITILLQGKVVTHSYRQFFDDIKKECGADISACFTGDDFSWLVNAFATLSDLLGMKTRKDGYGCWEAVDYSPNDSQRVEWAWKDYMASLRDDDLMDESAMKAINLNPKAKEQYAYILQDIDNQVADNNMEILSEKFKVSRL